MTFITDNLKILAFCWGALENFSFLSIYLSQRAKSSRLSGWLTVAVRTPFYHQDGWGGRTAFQNGRPWHWCHLWAPPPLPLNHLKRVLLTLIWTVKNGQENNALHSPPPPPRRSFSGFRWQRNTLLAFPSITSLPTLSSQNAWVWAGMVTIFKCIYAHKPTSS